MAELILTEAEKQAATYLDWDDAALGRAVKKLALFYGELRGDEALAATSSAVLLACQAATRPSGALTIELDGATMNKGRLESWRVAVTNLSGDGSRHRVGDPGNRRTKR